MARDLVALSGWSLQERTPLNKHNAFDGTDIDADFASTRRRQCPASGGDEFIRQQLLQEFIAEKRSSGVGSSSFQRRIHGQHWDVAMVRMGDLEPLTAENGFIRTCAAVHCFLEIRFGPNKMIIE
ncbi:UNVERIFIED_CONTAM: Lignin-forming anionic peroxidase [Sesamum radiatum]|uniref:Lignin-forming anionic peroxidase n=1 Tax=Sesamum radiatum TaxID=300843 RepID=A0AAW2W6D7_SESRA